MVKQRGVRVALLGEDTNQVSFARRVLLLLGFSRHEIIARPVPDGDGSGEQWVRKDYPTQVALNRKERSHQQCTLLVSIDADNKSVGQRKTQLDEELAKAEMARRGDDEPVAICVPNRNIETWLMHFAGEADTETENYKNKVKKPDFKQASIGFVEEYRRWQQNPNEVETLSSLVDAYEELRRIV